jgi:hypothetical protein
MTTINRHLTLRLRSFLVVAAAAACVLATADANAQAASPMAGQQPTVPDASQILRDPQVRHEGDVAYVTGGIGEHNEAQTMELGRDMNLKLVFARAPSGSYVANAKVRIADLSGNEVLALESSNPLLFAQLPPGTYRVTATAEGRSIERTVQVPSSGQQTEFFHW